MAGHPIAEIVQPAGSGDVDVLTYQFRHHIVM